MGDSEKRKRIMTTFSLSDAHIKILDAERAKHLAGKSKSYTWEEAKQIIRGKNNFF